MRVLITGAEGFIGSHLIEYLGVPENKISGLVLERNATIDNLEKSGLIKVYGGMVEDSDFIRSILIREEIDILFHLVGVRSSGIDVYKTNVLGTFSVLEAVRLSGRNIRTVIMGSSAEYGNVDKKLQPITEETPLNPITSYGVSKVAADLMGFQFFVNTGMPVYRVRPFNIIGPRQNEDSFCSALARQLVDIENKKQEPIVKIGDISAYRDFLDVRDAVRGLSLIAEKARGGEVYNLCSGRVTQIKAVAEKMVGLINIKVKLESSSLSSRDNVAYQRGSYAKINAETGWRPQLNLGQSLSTILDYFRQKGG